ncbi:MAG: hypothetical protein ACI85O_000760 [Saprospiraceae bacterium]|jgi:hypothetical protein
MHEVGRISEAVILFPFEAKNTDNIVYWRDFSTRKGDKRAILRPSKSHS